jgi:hypothetical protein
MNTEPTWLLFLTSQTGQSSKLRMRLWRALKHIGAAILRDGVYLLPWREDLQKNLAAQVAAVREQGGSAYLLNVETFTPADTDALRGLFERSADYLPLFEALSRWHDELAQMNETQARRGLRQLQRELTALQAVDYFPGPDLARAQQLLAQTEMALNRRFSPHEPHAGKRVIEQRSAAEFKQCLWATRARLWIDRVASAWLIRRFIDTRARFVWLDDPAGCPADAIGFDFDGAEFSHVGELITFEVLLASFDLTGDPALTRLAALVHYLDVGGIAVAEAAGFEAILAGVRAYSRDDDELLAAMQPVLDALYSGFQQKLS